jgi:hypothetical protein
VEESRFVRSASAALSVDNVGANPSEARRGVHMVRRSIEEPLDDSMSSDVSLGDLVDLLHASLEVFGLETLGVVGSDRTGSRELLFGELINRVRRRHWGISFEVCRCVVTTVEEEDEPWTCHRWLPAGACRLDGRTLRTSLETERERRISSAWLQVFPKREKQGVGDKLDTMKVIGTIPSPATVTGTEVQSIAPKAIEPIRTHCRPIPNRGPRENRSVNLETGRGWNVLTGHQVNRDGVAKGFRVRSRLGNGRKRLSELQSRSLAQEREKR